MAPQVPRHLRVESFKLLRDDQNIHIDPRRTVLLTDGLDFYLTETSVNVDVITHARPKKWLGPNAELYKYDRTLIQPEAKSTMTRIDETNTDLGTIFTKTPPLNSLSFRDSVEEGSLRQVEITEREISICEILRAHPHPNICAYHGVSVKDNRVTGVCFERYALTLHDMVKKGLQFDADACLAAIEAGLDHLHSLNIIHCDIKPGNIFATPYPYPNPAPTSSFIPAYQFVIGDFDSAHVKGGELRLKSGTPGWMSKHAFNAHREVDFHGLSMVRWWLVGKGYGVPDAQTTYEKTAVILEVADMSYCHS